MGEVKAVVCKKRFWRDSLKKTYVAYMSDGTWRTATKCLNKYTLETEMITSAYEHHSMCNIVRMFFQINGNTLEI